MSATPADAPSGEISIQTIAMPADANWYGDIFGGWLMSQLDLAGAVCARRRAHGRVATVAIDRIEFLRPVPVGAVVSCYTQITDTGNSSIKIQIQAWISTDGQAPQKVTEGHFVFVAIDDDGQKRRLPAQQEDITV